MPTWGECREKTCQRSRGEIRFRVCGLTTASVRYLWSSDTCNVCSRVSAASDKKSQTANKNFRFDLRAKRRPLKGLCTIKRTNVAQEDVTCALQEKTDCSNVTNGSMTIETNSFETIHLRPSLFETTTFETTFIWDLFIWDHFIWDHVHLRPVHLRSHSFETFSFETTFIWHHSHLRPQSFETTLIWDFFIWDHIHLRPHSFETTVIWDHIYLRPHSFETTFIWGYIHLRLH